MVVAVRCPNPKCRKYMLVEDTDQGNKVPCLICKQPVRVPTPQLPPMRSAPALASSPAAVPPTAPPPPPDESTDLAPIFDD